MSLSDAPVPLFPYMYMGYINMLSPKGYGLLAILNRVSILAILFSNRFCILVLNWVILCFSEEATCNYLLVIKAYKHFL